MKLTPRFIEKPWGRVHLPPPFDSVVTGCENSDNAIGEIWLEPDDGRDLPVLVKYLFTSEKLSVQVHPNDAQAQAQGWKSGKNECWYITDVEPGAMLGLGLCKSLTQAELRDAALNGSIEDLLDWRPLHKGQFFVVPAGTIHAMSAGISLIEFQQNIDLTYRLYDYGRPRELHLDDAVSVADAGPYPDAYIRTIDSDALQAQLLAHFPQFDVYYARDIAPLVSSHANQACWIVPLAGDVAGGGDRTGSGDCLYLAPGQVLDGASADRCGLVGFATSTS